jgi:hypothetical protein
MIGSEPNPERSVATKAQSGNKKPVTQYLKTLKIFDFANFGVYLHWIPA